MDRFLEMRVFVAVVDEGSLVKAGEALGMSKPAVSRYLSSLEERLGARLLHRTTRRLSLTPEGEVFVDRSRNLLAELEEAEAEVAERGGQAVGLLRVNVPLTFGVLYLAELWGPFQARYPQLILDITLIDRVVDLVEEGYDLAVRIAPMASSTLISRKLSSTRMLLCASPQYLERVGHPRHPSELEHHAIWAYRYFAPGDEWPFEGPDGALSARIRPRVRTNSGETCRAAALQHRGIVLQPSFLVGPDITAGRLVEVLPEYRSIDVDICAVYPSRKHVAAKVRLMIDYLVESFRDRSWFD